MVVEGTRIVFAGKADDGVHNGGRAVNGQLGLLIGHGVVTLLASLEAGDVFITGLDVAGGVGVNEIWSVDFVECGEVLFDDGFGPGFFGGADGVFRCGGGHGEGEEDEVHG